MPPTDLPSGTVTFLFTDIEGSTKLLEQDPVLLQEALVRHHILLTAAIEENQGHVFETVGDAFYAAFPNASNAIAAAIDAQLALNAEPWDARAPIKARMSIHTGDVDRMGAKYFGATLFRSARLLSASHGGQIILSASTVELARDGLLEPISLRDLGDHRLRDLIRPERIWQITHPDLPERFPPLRTLSTLPNNLPSQLTSFVGRDRDLEEARRLLRSNRLLTLTGPGGAGKTRLATQVGADLLHDFEHGVWFIDLAPLTSSEQVSQAIASVFSVNPRPNQSPLGALVAHLEPKHVLLILDNCEHLVSASAKAADSVLQGCPEVKLLATSREVLGVPGEVSRVIPSLSVPPSTQSLSIEQIARYESMRLFVDRAIAVSPRFELTKQNAPSVTQICRRLDGIPLAIELAASRVRVLSPEQIAARLDDCFRLLTGGSRTLLPRQQTLRALIDWSHDLLTEPERIVLRRLSVFSGSFSIEAAESVGSGNGVDAEEVLDLVTQLVEKSLILADEQANGTRFRLLESMRQYATEKLVAASELEDTRRRHASYFVTLAEDAEPYLVTRERALWLKHLEAEFDNLRAILASARAALVSGDNSPTDVKFGLRLVGALAWYWIFRGALAEGHFWFTQLLDAGPTQRTPELGKALNGAGMLAGIYGQSTLARSRLEAAVTTCLDVGEKRELGRAMLLLSAFGESPADMIRATELFDAGTAHFQETGDTRGLALCVRLAGVLALQSGNRHLARTRQEAALALFRVLGDSWFTAQTLNTLGDIARTEGDDARATSLYQDALTLCRESHLTGLIPSLLQNLGQLARRVGDCARAAALFKESLSLFRDQGDVRGVAECVGGLAIVYAAIDRTESAAQLFGAVEGILAATGAEMWPANRSDYIESRQSVHTKLGDAAFGTSLGAGQAMSMEQVVVYALQED